MSSSSSWMQTYSGRQFWPLEPKAEHLAIEDIAHSLANQCRFAGHTTRFYSVAQHSVLVSQAVSEESALWGLLHDASEAYLVDFPRPLKYDGEFRERYKFFEGELMAVICEKYKLPIDMPADVKQADEVLLATEKRDLMASEPAPWSWLPAPQPRVIIPWPPTVAKAAFMARFEELTVGLPR